MTVHEIITLVLLCSSLGYVVGRCTSVPDCPVCGSASHTVWHEEDQEYVCHATHVKESGWKRFHFESNRFFDTIEGPEDWERLCDAYPGMDDDELLSAKQATYGGTMRAEDMAEHPNYGFRLEHDGDKTLRDFFRENNMTL
jgi:hypothetical protein